MKKLEFWLLKFTEYMKRSGFSETSIPDYLRNVGYFFDYLKELGINNVAEADHRVVSDYQTRVCLQTHRGKALAHTTQRKRLACLKTFYRYLLKAEAVILDPTCDMELPRVRDQLPRDILTKHEIGKLVSQRKRSLIVFAIPAPPICLKEKRTSVRFKRSWVMPPLPPPSATQGWKSQTLKKC